MIPEKYTQKSSWWQSNQAMSSTMQHVDGQPQVQYALSYNQFGQPVYVPVQTTAPTPATSTASPEVKKIADTVNEFSPLLNVVLGNILKPKTATPAPEPTPTETEEPEPKGIPGYVIGLIALVALVLVIFIVKKFILKK